jgi:hypothetical protein
MTKTAVIKKRIARALEALRASGLVEAGPEKRFRDPRNRRTVTIFLARALELYWPGATRPHGKETSA